MKILIFSDSHLNIRNLMKMVEIEKPDIIISGGDHCKDAEELSFIETNLKYYIVKGNCDLFDSKFKDILEFSLENKKIYLTHGHLHGVKMSLSKLKKDAENEKKDIVIFGHTHIPYYELDNNVHYFNPGAANDGRYGILFLDKDKVHFEHKMLK